MDILYTYLLRNIDNSAFTRISIIGFLCPFQGEVRGTNFENIFLLSKRKLLKAVE